MPELPSCDRVRAALYADEVIDELGAHLASCEDCRRLAIKLREVDSYFRNTPIPEPSPDLFERILKAMRDR